MKAQKFYGVIGGFLQVAWIVLGWCLPLTVFYAVVGAERGYEIVFSDFGLGLGLSFGGFAILLLSLIGGILLNIGDAQEDSARARLAYAGILPLYPFVTVIRSIVWFRETIDTREY